MKRRIHWGLLGVVGTFPLTLTFDGPVSAADVTAAARRTATEYVSKALQAEIEGKNSRRQGRLDAALEEAPDLPAAHWNSGDVWSDKHWVKFDDPSVAGNKPRLAAYLHNREKYRNTVEDQLALAKWCKTAGLKDEWRAHLGNVLALNPDHAEARAALGYQLVDGVWMTPKEIAQGKARSSAAVAALKKWKSKLVAIRDELQSRNPNLRKAAQTKLDAIQDAAAIPAVELVFCGDSESMALTGVNHFGDMRVTDASLALVRQALFANWPEVRKEARTKLKSRNRETFVPELLSVMHSPVESRIEAFQEPDGRLFYRQAFYRTGQDRDELQVFDNMYNPVYSPSAIRPGIGGKFEFDDGGRIEVMPNGKVRPLNPQSAYDRNMTGRAAGFLASSGNLTAKLTPVNPDAAAAAARGATAMQAAADAQATQVAVATQNAQTVAFNSAVCQLLTDVTGETQLQSPDAWSQWWVDTDEVYVPEYKPLSTTYVPVEHDTYVQVPMEREVVMHFSCLAAGTPVWTDAGPVAVEKIKVGDRVLAQDAETGELAYKPVMHTTVRLKADLVKLDLRDEIITCSVGHRFWISGKGWLKARDIEPGMNFHGAVGTTPLRQSEPAGVGAVYNLIVADFHSYFVGKAMIYSHDITARKPTDRLVPGLVLSSHVQRPRGESSH
jgi:hypothetical protein